MLNRQISVTRATCATYILELKICNLPWHTLREKPTCDFIKQFYWRWNIQDIRHLRYIQEDANLTYSKTPFMRPQLGHKILVVNTRRSCSRGSQNNKTIQCYLRLGSLRKQPTCRDVTTGLPAKWGLRNERRNSILLTCYSTDLASDWLRRKGNYFNQLPGSR